MSYFIWIGYLPLYDLLIIW